MSKRGRVLVSGRLAGWIEEREGDCIFTYTPEYLADDQTPEVSLSLPKRSEPYREKTMIPFFDGLIPEGWMLDLVASNWKIDPRDRMSLLLAVCRDCIGNVSIEPEAPAS